ncbi:MAG: sigma 54-interacting transcriptional regulator [Deltaproteobacteria bacterium]|nr:sigma 54-interacting transcriptional regulator [Deltaproteobacteria bacterium]
MRIKPQFSLESEAIIQHCTYGICVADSDGVMTRVNSAFEHITGLGSQHFLDLHVQDAVDKGIIDNSSILRLLRRKRPSTATVTTMAGKKLFSSAFPVYDKRQNVIRLATIMRSVQGTQSLRELESFFGDHAAFHPAQTRVVGASPQMVEIFNRIERLSLFDCPVLLMGETGVGKGLFARIIHERSPSCQGPFLTVNCSAIPAHLMESELFGYEPGAFTGARRNGKEGLLESARGGTLLLDEIGDLPLELQPKLLRVIEARSVLRVGAVEEKPVNTRIIASTNRDMETMVADGRFRPDLFYRLNVVPMTIPPLRERREDIPELLYHHLEQFNLRYGTSTWISPEAVDTLTGYGWPGNVRELANLMERLVILQGRDLIQVEDLPGRLQDSRRPTPVERIAESRPARSVRPLKEELEGYEKALLSEALRRYARQEDAARALGISMSTLTRKTRKHGLKASSADPDA